jgi:prepilin-type N-terminal cleavage/methylation domain-containing protein
MSFKIKKRLPKSQRGVSLVEIMVAVVVFAIVVLAVMSILHWARGHIVRMGMRRNALVLAQAKIEELRAGFYSDVDLSVGDHGPESVPVTQEIVGSRVWSVTLQDDPGVAGTQDYKNVIVGVFWSWEVTNSDSVSLSGRFYP